MNVSHETIYLYIYLHAKKELKAELIAQLRQERKRRGNFKTRALLESKIKDRVSIDERPEEVLGREIPGRWEGDLIIGKDHKSCLGTLVELTTRTIILVPLKNKNAATVRKAFEKKVLKITTNYEKNPYLRQWNRNERTQNVHPENKGTSLLYTPLLSLGKTYQ